MDFHRISGKYNGAMFVIFGTSIRRKQMGSGSFLCPFEDKERAFKHIKESDWFTLFFIAIFKWRDGDEYVECQSCATRYPPKVLKKVEGEGGI